MSTPEPKSSERSALEPRHVRPASRPAFDSENSGFAMIPAFAAAMARLHRNKRGNISLFFLLLAFVFYAAAALVWNTGTATNASIHTQIAADSAAYSSAMWTSRGVNNVVGANMVILRNASAQIVSAAVISFTIQVPLWWAKWINENSDPCGPFKAACAAALALYIAITELPYYLDLVLNAFPTALQKTIGNDFGKRIGELHDFQKGWVDAIPNAIETQREHLEGYYNVDIRLTRPGDSDGKIKPPVEQGNFLSFMIPLGLRFAMSDNNWPSKAKISKIKEGKGTFSWYSGATLGYALTLLIHGNKHYVLESQMGPLEFGPDSLSDRKPFTVVAHATMKNATGGRLAMPGVFNAPIARGDRITSYAQAETYNGIDERMKAAFNLPWPFRVWTTWGWQWQPRLTLGDQLENALSDDSELRQIYQMMRILQSDYGNLDDIALH